MIPLPLFVNINTRIPGSIHDLYTITRSGIPIIGWLILSTAFAIGGVLVDVGAIFSDIFAIIFVDVSFYFFGTALVLLLYALLPGLLIAIMFTGGIAVLLAIVGYAISQFFT